MQARGEPDHGSSGPVALEGSNASQEAWREKGFGGKGQSGVMPNIAGGGVDHKHQQRMFDGSNTSVFLGEV